METQPSPAEELPALYRSILDGVAQLETRGQRREAALVRAEATAVYSASWNDANRRRLAAIARRIDRVLAGVERPRVPNPRQATRIAKSAVAR